MKSSIQFESDFSLKGIEGAIAEINTIIYDAALQAVVDLEKSSPVGVTKQLRSGWQIDAASDGKDTIVSIVNTASVPLFRLEGRKAGRMPPIEAIRAWAESKGIPPYLVARKIAREGTDRSKRNFREFDPATGEPAKNGAIARALRKIKRGLDKLEIKKL